jgi:G:T/U-mismatch repair DNA glycosylase
MQSEKSVAKTLNQKEIVLRGGDGPQFYGDPRSPFWNIVGSAFGFQRCETPFEEQVELLTAKGYSVWNVLSEAQRKGSSVSNIVKGSISPNDIPRFVLDHPKLNRLVFIANSADNFCKRDVWKDWVDTGKASTCRERVHTKFWIRGRLLNPGSFERTNAVFGKKKAVETVDNPAVAFSYSQISTVDDDNNTDDSDQNGRERRLIELIVMPSTSPANVQVRPPEKEKIWHQACYHLQEPPLHYECPGCKLYDTSSESEKHWFYDCPHRNDWKAYKKEQNKKRSNQIDPFYWYY